LQEKEITVPTEDLLEIFGTNNSRLKTITSHFPKLKIVARGQTIKVMGESEEIARFESSISKVFEHVLEHHILEETVLESILDGQSSGSPSVLKYEIIVSGPGGNKVKARTANQQRIVDACKTNDMVFAVGPAGTGKTYTAVALAVQALKEKKVRRIILTRPAVEAGENLGFLPGDLKEKLDPYLQPLYDALMDMIHYDKLADYLDKNVIEIAPLAFMRGRTLDKAFVILDEAQNTTIPQMKMFLTRMGRDAKFIITGDDSQVDLPVKQPSGLIHSVKILEETKGIEIVHLDVSDIIRHKLVTRIIRAFDKNK
jgi:phosphate starvation-inducible PhoH-like protein